MVWPRPGGFEGLVTRSRDLASEGVAVEPLELGGGGGGVGEKDVEGAELVKVEGAVIAAISVLFIASECGLKVAARQPGQQASRVHGEPTWQQPVRLAPDH